MKKKFLLLVDIILLSAMFSACGNKEGENTNSNSSSSQTESHDESAAADESLFEWDGNLITAVTEDGSKQEDIVVPARCEGFSGQIFANTDIKRVSFEDDDDIALDFAFYGAENIVSVDLPDGLTIIPTVSFQACKNLQSVTIPAAVTTLESYAFENCSSLANVVFLGERITTIGDNAFYGCDSLTSITIPEGVTTIEEYAFFECESLTDVTFGDTVSSIEKFAFGNTAISEIHFPENIQFTSMDASAFGTNAYTSTVYIVKDSWCDQNQSVWDVGFNEIKYE